MHIRMPSPTVKERDNGAALAITTTFVPVPQCTESHLTMLGRQQFFVWLNEPVPVVGTTVSFCYPKQFITSYIDSLAGTTLPAFSPLVCPQNYQTISKQDLGGDAPYIVCCPNNYDFAQPAAPDPNRPGAGGTCYSNIIGTTVTKYNENAYSGLIFFSTSGQAYAHPLDGFAFQGQHIATTSQVIVAPAPSTSAHSNSAPSAPAPSAPAPSASAPSSQSSSETAVATSESTSATSKSTSISQKHNTLPQSLPTQTLSPISVSTAPSSVIPLSTSGTTVIYSTIPPSLVTIFTAEPIGTSTASPQPSAAPSSTPIQSSALDNGQKAGIAIGAILGTFLVGAIIFFLLRRRRAQSMPAEVSHSPPYMHEKPSLADHPSTRGYPNEKSLHKSASSTDYYELNSPQMETHELGAGRDGDPAGNTVKELEAAPVQKVAQDSASSTRASASSPNKI